jgi:hypothetical protein
MRVSILVLLVSLAPAGAWAQTSQAPPQPGQGPLVLERVESGFAVAPDYRFTDLDGKIAHLAGGYAGQLTDNRLFLGGAFYTTANRADDFKLTYGGFLMGWTAFPERRVTFGVRGLVGLGTATLGTNVDVRGFDAGRYRGRTVTGTSGGLTTVRVLEGDDFFAFEPQATFVARLADHIALNVGAGYRVSGFTDRLHDRLNGASGSVAVQFWGW